MKIIIVLRNIGPYHQSRFESIVNSNLDVYAFETRPQSQEYLWSSLNSCKYKIIKFPKSIYTEKDITNREIDAFYKKNISLIKPDAIVSVGWADRSYQRLLIYANSKNIPCLVVSDSIIKKEKNKRRFFLKEFLKKIILRGYSSAFVAGKESKEYLIKLGFKEEKIFYPWDVVDNIFFEKYTSKSNKSGDKYFLCVSRLLERKNLFNLIKSFSSYHKKGGLWGLKIIGSGNLYLKLKKYADKIIGHEKIEIINWLQIYDLVDYYKNASAFILPSYFDNWGLVVNEAIASGLPCIVSQNCGCAVDLIKNEETGFVFNPNKNYELQKYMEKVESLTKDERLKMIALARANLKNYDLDIFSKNFKKAIVFSINNPRKSLMSSLLLRAISTICP